VWNLHNPQDKKSIWEFKGQQVHALAGIGFPEIFFASIRQIGIDTIEHKFPDHHDFKSEDLDLKPDLPILVTHKDAVKLKGMMNPDIWVVPLGIELSQDLKDQIMKLLEAKQNG
jgi:tetraacyldisaccharide 4'-kinase